MAKIIAYFVFAAILLIIFSLLVHPTMYYYTYMGERHTPLKINRWNGEVYFYDLEKGKWNK